ncbi:hypothetical protein N7490_006861 [Penicillium lividum]|nr:hypothetical protein N7490_006861 [Penicillium lividum]
MDIANYFLIERRTDSPESDHGDEIAIAALYLLVMMIMAVLIRLAFRFSMLRSFQRDDGMISLALVFGIAQSALIFQGTKDGMGKRQSALSTQQVIDVEKSIYASDLLYVLAIGLTKVSVLEFLNKLVLLVIDRRDNLDISSLLYFGFQMRSTKAMGNG